MEPRHRSALPLSGLLLNPLNFSVLQPTNQPNDGSAVTEGRGQVLYYCCCVIVIILFFSTYPAGNPANTAMCVSGFFFITTGIIIGPFVLQENKLHGLFSRSFLIRFLLQGLLVLVRTWPCHAGAFVQYIP